jgi:hypothetical protein
MSDISIDNRNYFVFESEIVRIQERQGKKEESKRKQQQQQKQQQEQATMLQQADNVKFPTIVSPMLATLVDNPFHNEDWVFEVFLSKIITKVSSLFINLLLWIYLFISMNMFPLVSSVI